MKYALLPVLLAMALASCSGSNTAAVPYQPPLTNPQAVRVGNNTLLLSAENNEIRGYAPSSGGTSTFWAILTTVPGAEDARLYDIASDASGRLYALGATDTEPGVYDVWPSADIMIWYRPLLSPQNMYADFYIGGLNTNMDHHARSVAIDATGKIYVGDLRDVLVFAPFVAGQSQVDQSPIASLHTSFAQIASVRLDRYNNVYVLGTNHVVEKFAAGSSGNATPIRTITVAGGISRSGSLAIGRNGDIYTLASSNTAPTSTRVLVYAANGGNTPTREIAGSKTGLLSSTALAVCADGTLYVGGNGTIRVFAPGSSGNALATVVWRRSGGIPIQSLNW